MADSNPDRARVFLLECLTASAILVIAAIVLFMVFSYKPY